MPLHHLDGGTKGLHHRIQPMAFRTTNLRARRTLSLVIAALVVVVLLVCLALYIGFYAIDGASLEQGQERASELLVAMEEYRQDIGRYPSGLSELVPDYLPAVPRPAWRYEYYCKVDQQGTKYFLYFRQARDADNYCGYSSEAKEWMCTDSVPPYTYE
jgi:hypothetical protein